MKKIFSWGILLFSAVFLFAGLNSVKAKEITVGDLKDNYYLSQDELDFLQVSSMSDFSVTYDENTKKLVISNTNLSLSVELEYDEENDVLRYTGTTPVGLDDLNEQTLLYGLVRTKLKLEGKSDEFIDDYLYEFDEGMEDDNNDGFSNEDNILKVKYNSNGNDGYYMGLFEMKVKTPYSETEVKNEEADKKTTSNTSNNAETKKTVKNPKTGDTLFKILGAITLAGAGFVVTIKKAKQK